MEDIQLHKCKGAEWNQSGGAWEDDPEQVINQIAFCFRPILLTHILHKKYLI